MLYLPRYLINAAIVKRKSKNRHTSLLQYDYCPFVWFPLDTFYLHSYVPFIPTLVFSLTITHPSLCHLPRVSPGSRTRGFPASGRAWLPWVWPYFLDRVVVASCPAHYIIIHHHIGVEWHLTHTDQRTGFCAMPCSFDVDGTRCGETNDWA